MSKIDWLTLHIYIYNILDDIGINLSRKRQSLDQLSQKICYTNKNLMPTINISHICKARFCHQFMYIIDQCLLYMQTRLVCRINTKYLKDVFFY